MEIYDGSFDKSVGATTHTVRAISAGRIAELHTDTMTLRRRGRRDDYSLLYCRRGRILVEDGELRTGQVWIYPPRVSQRYAVRVCDGVIYHYLHFTGSDLPTLLGELNIPVCTPILAPEGTGELMEKIEADLLHLDAKGALLAEMHALRLLSLLAEGQGEARTPTLLKRVNDRMEHAFAEPYDAKEYAAMLGVSESRFLHLFKEHEGCSPYERYTAIRMANAKGLLACTALPIGEVGRRCGYADPLYFTQAFKRATGLSPRAYRREKSAL